MDEFEKQKLKIEKGAQMCMFCKKKPGKYKCDCECVVCKEHSQLKKEEGDGESYKVVGCNICGINHLIKDKDWNKYIKSEWSYCIKWRQGQKWFI